MTSESVLELIVKRMGDSTQKDFAQTIGISQQYLNDVLRRRRAPGPKLLRWLGLEKMYGKAKLTSKKRRPSPRMNPGVSAPEVFDEGD